MLKKLMAQMGVGASKVDLVLDKQHVELGEELKGVFRIEGGAVEQQINHISADLIIQFHYRTELFTHVVATIPIASSFIIRPGESKELPFQYPLSARLPISRNGIRYHIKTRLDIADGIDDLDRDAVHVCPPERFNSIVRALDMLGFREKHDSGKFNGTTQEFEFSPVGVFKGKVQEVEFEAALEKDGIRLLLEVDMFQLLGFGEKELRQQIFLRNEQLADARALSHHLEAVIQEMTQNPHAYPASRYPSGLGGAIGSQLRELR